MKTIRYKDDTKEIITWELYWHILTRNRAGKIEFTVNYPGGIFKHYNIKQIEL